MGIAERINLDDSDIITIWESGLSIQELAGVFQVPEKIVSLIKQGKFGSKITNDLPKAKQVSTEFKALQQPGKKLNVSKVLYIINSTESNLALAKKLGVTANTVGKIRTGTTWKMFATLPRPVYKQANGKLIGEKNHRAKLTAEKVQEIVALFDTHSDRQIAQQFNVGKTTVFYIRCGKIWKHVTGGVWRPAIPHLRGTNHPNAKVTDENVRFIRSSSLSTRELSEQFGISTNAVREIRRRRCWKHI